MHATGPRIIIDRTGLRSGNLKALHGVHSIPWEAIAHMDLYHTDPRLPPHLRIELRPGALRERVRQHRIRPVGAGLDVNLPVAVDATPEAVLETAQRFWKAHGQRPGG